MNGTFSLLGVDELLAKINAVKEDVKYKGGRFALRKAAMIVARSVEQNASLLDDPKTKEKIYLNAKVRWSTKLFKRTGNLGFRVGILGGAKQPEDKDAGKNNPGGQTYHWRFLEFGTQKHRATPFMRPAMERNINAATNEFINQYKKALDRAIKRGG